MRARKRFGQHFLEPVWVAKVIRAIDPRPTDTFVEIGPGHGALTRPLAACAGRVVAVEIDRDLAAELRAEGLGNVRVIEGDFLDVERFPVDGPARVAGNLPYNVASPILFKLIEYAAAGVPIVDATIMLQREVADRLVARPGTKDYGVLSVMVQQSAAVERLLALPPGAFRPAPKVRSAVVGLRFHPPDPKPRDPAVFASLVRAVFTQRRKTLANALTSYVKRGRESFSDPHGWLDAAGIDGRRRAETLAIPELVRLADAVAATAGRSAK